jgi:peroxiredoxin
MNHRCPVILHHLDWLKQLQADLQQQGITLVGIHTNPTPGTAQVELSHMKTFAVDHRLNFPYLQDATQEVTEGFGVQTFPSACLINRDGVLCSSHAIATPQSPQATPSKQLQAAIAQILSR